MLILANPKRFLALADAVLPFVAVISIVMLVSGLSYALFFSPVDYQQGEAVRIMYVHVPAAWMALGVYLFMASMGAVGIIWRSPLAHILAHSASVIGMSFTVICLATGSFWGKPIWGTWWVWDARLTSMLILLFFYIGYIMLYNSSDNEDRASKSAAILAILGVVNIPIIKFSVNWWNTLHQPASILRTGGVAIHSDMLKPLFLMFGFYISYFIIVLILRVKTKINVRKAERVF